MKKIFLLFCLLFAISKQSLATDYTINNVSDLANHLATANLNPTSPDRLIFNVACSLSVALPTITKTGTGSLEFVGNGYEIAGINAFTMLTISVGSNVIIRNLTIRGGSGTLGGGINNAGILTLTDCVIRNNTATGVNPVTLVAGGGIYNTGTLTIARSTIHSNIVTNTGSVSAGAGAGIFHQAGNLTMNYCTISGNEIQNITGFSNLAGAGIYCNSSTFQLDNLSIVSNVNGAGLAVVSFAASQIQNSLFLDHDGVDIDYLALPPAIDISSQKLLFTSVSTNLTTDPSQLVTVASITDIIDLTLRDNGGSTLTHALLANNNNIAIEGGTPIVGLNTDQRGESFLGTAPDIGAYEFGTFWVTDNTGFSSNVIGTLSKSLKDANFSFPNAPQNNLNNVSVFKKIKFNIPAPNNTINLFFNPVLKLPIIIDATTQPNYATQPNQRVKWTRGTGNSGIALHINATATGSKVFGLIIGVPSPVTARFLTGIKISASNVQIGKLTTSPTFDGLNVFQGCTNGIVVNGSNAAIHRNFFGLNIDGTDGGADNYSQGYDIVVGDSVALANTVIGVFGSGNVLAAKNGGISFTTLPALASISNTSIGFNKIGETLDRTPILGNATGIHTNGNIDDLDITNNVIVNRALAAGIFLNDNTKNVTIAANQIGWQYNTANVPIARPCLYGIQIRGGGNSNNININNNSIAGNKPTTSAGTGIYIEAGNFADDAITIESNRIGLANNTSPLPADAIVPNHWGIHSEGINNSFNFLTIISNIISGNDEKGIYIRSGAGVLIRNNILGLKPDDSEAPNKGTSIDMRGQGLVDNNIIAGNFDTMFPYDGVYIGSISVMVRNNLIGLKNNAGVDIFRPNSGVGINVGAGLLSDIEISGNTISGNNEAIILMSKIDFLQNNKIGTASNGDMLTLPAGRTHANLNYGIDIRNTVATGMIISNNTISSSEVAGIKIAASGVRIESNKIGLNSAGTSAIPNTTGIDIGTGLGLTTIGGVNPTDGNSFAATNIGILSASPCIIQHNTFGTSHDGTIPLTNFGNLSLMQPTFATQAISIAHSSGSSSIDNNVICGATNNTLRTILGNTVTGSAEAILISGNNIDVTNNKIGITLNDIAIPNDIGISTQGVTSSCNIGVLGGGNFIANNTNAAIHINSSPAPAITSSLNIIGNYIGMQTDLMIIPRLLSDDPTQIGIAAENNTNVGMDNNVINNTTKIGIVLGNSLSAFNQIINTTIGDLNPSIGFNTIAGISVGSTWTIGSSSVITNCEGVGIKIQGSFNTLYGNTIFNNGLQGINISSGNGNRLGENSIYNNGGTATPNPKGVDLNLATVAIQGNDGQVTPTITSATILPMNQMTISGTASPDGSHFCYFYRTTTADVSGNANLVEGKDYIGQATIAVTGGVWTTTIPTQPLLTPALSSTDFITMNTQYSPITSVFNTSEFSPAYSLCPTSITAITTQNVITTCFGTTADVRLNISTNSNAGSKFDIDIDNNGTFDYTSLNLQTDAAGKFLLLTGVVGGTAFTNTKVFDVAQNCLSASFQNTVTISNAIKPQPIIRAARLVQATSCSSPNARLIVKLQNFEPNAYYSIRIGGVNPLLAQLVGDSLTAVLANVAIGTSIGANLQVSQAPNCVSPNFPFSAVLQTPSPAIDTTLNVSTPNDEISPNFAAQILVRNSKDSVVYSLVRADNSQVIGNTQQGNGATLTFSTGILATDGNYKYVISARHLRTNCAANLAQTITIKVFSGIYPEDLDILREIYTSTNGDNWDIKWNFAQSFTTFIGVSTFGGRVTSILLPNNNLTGVLTRNTLNLRKLATLDISNNSLDFGSVESFVNQRFVFTYTNQAKINRSIDTTAYTGTSMTLSLSTRGTANLYQWQKDGVNISGATSNSLTINPLQNTDAGLYTCLVRNTIGTQLTLTRNNIRLRTITRNVSSTDLTLLIKINESLGGANWTTKWKLDGTVPVAELYGIKMEGDKIKYINLADNNLVGTMPDIIPLGSNILSDLIYLNLSGNQISGTIPASIGNLKKLQYLDLSNNALRGEINKEIGDLPDLATLFLAQNQFTTLHANLNNLARLENLFLQQNQFTNLFADWSKLTALKKLSLSGNLLKTLPQSLDKLTNLEVLELANNQFVTLPNIFGSMGKLQEISLQNNQLTDLPVSFATLTRLQNMVLHTNFLDFEDLEKLQPLPVLNAEGAVYEPQAKIGTAQEILFTTDQTLDLTQPAKGTANSYLWLKDGQPVNNLTMQRILRSPIAFSDAGVYTLTVKNNIAKKLTLFSREILVRVSCGNSSSIEISQAGTNRYCEGENINTTLSAKALNGIQAIGYQWFRNNARLVNEETSKLSLVQAGSYVVHIRGGDGCVFISQPVEILVAAKPKIDLKQVQEKLQVAVNQSKGKLQYAWYYNNLQIDEARSSELKTTKAGQYYVIVTDSLNCPAKSQVVNVIISGLEDEQNANFKLYPNPTENVLNIEIPLDFDFQTLQVYNLLGQLATVKVQKQDANLLQIQVANLSSGVYWVEIKGRKGSLKRKFVKE